MAVAIAAWALLYIKLPCRRWKLINRLLLLPALAAILYATLSTRESGDYVLLLDPLEKLEVAHIQPELYREMLMNALLFLPLGLTLSHALPDKLPRWGRILLTVICGCLLSTGIEYIQYRFSLGMAETSDVICNTLGVALGALSLLLAHTLENRSRKAAAEPMTLTPIEAQFLTLIRAAMSGGSGLSENGGGLSPDTDCAPLFDLARQQKLLPILHEYLRKTPAADAQADLFAAVKQQSIAQVLGQTMRSMEFSALYGQLRAAGLHPLVVKGQLCSRLYPWADHRLSGDDDLLIPDGELAACHRALVARGLHTACPEDRLTQADEIAYTQPGGPLYIELHRRLFDSSEDAHDELNGFFTDIHAQTVEVGGFLSMPPHEHLLYLILHAYKHFVRSGIGLRQFCDIGLWAQEYHGEIDWARLYDQCRRVHAATFASTAFAIARQWLGIGFPLPAQWERAVSAEPLLHDTLCGGVYGSNDLTRLHSATVTLNAVKSSRRGQRGSALAALFPNRRYMAQKYPYVQKMPLLLPLAWGQRLIHYLGERRRSQDSSAAPLQLARERIELMRMYEIME